MNVYPLALGAALVGFSCGGLTATPETTATGRVALSSFPGSVGAVVAVAGGGKSVRSAVDARGDFALALPKGDTYSLSVVVDGRGVPLVMPRRSGKLQRGFKVSSNGVSIALGTVRYLGAGAKPSFVVGSSGRGCTGECVQDDGASTCENGQTVGADGEAGAECENGFDVKTHAACTDPEPTGGTDGVDSSVEMAVPERDAPNDANGCDDNQEQEGDH